MSLTLYSGAEASVTASAWGLGFCSLSGHTKDFKSSIRSPPQGARHKRKCEGLSVCVVRLVCPLTAFNHS